MPQAILNDGFSSSEAIGMGASVMAKGGEVQTAKFMLGERCKVFDENDNPVEPGSGVAGMVAIGPPNPVGYYKDEEKTARTFRTIDGVRYSIPGDWCVVEADGTLTLLGRGNACINTAGEKVFPEEVEEALKTHPSDRGRPGGRPAGREVGPGGDRRRPPGRGPCAGRGRPARPRAPLPGRLQDAQADHRHRTDIRASNGKADYPTAKTIAQEALAEA